MKQKIIFLDFDGVLTSQKETPGSYITHEACEYGASPSCLELLKSLCDETGAKIVVSSNWRKFDDDGPCSFWTHSKYARTVFNPLPKLRKQLESYMIGALPKARHATKAQALILWFEENHLTEDDIDYVIFDDDVKEEFSWTDEHGIKDHFVLTSSFTGLVESDIAKAKAILKCEK